jgi:two-component system nitrate/nitrite response regulator NarL
MSENHSKKTVVVCDTQPIIVEGLRSLLAAAEDLEFLASFNSLAATRQMSSVKPPNVVIVDKGFGMCTVLDWIRDLKLDNAAPAVTVWGISMTETEALRLLRMGAKGVVRKTADLESILNCLRTVASGGGWTEDSLSLQRDRHLRLGLTPREHQVREMVEQGSKNREIALELGIRPGTVKIHLRHIFEKTGVRSRYGLAVSGMKERGLVSMTG